MKKTLKSLLVLLAASAIVVAIRSFGKRGVGEKTGAKADEAVDGAKEIFDGAMPFKTAAHETEVSESSQTSPIR